MWADHLIVLIGRNSLLFLFQIKGSFLLKYIFNFVGLRGLKDICHLLVNRNRNPSHSFMVYFTFRVLQMAWLCDFFSVNHLKLWSNCFNTFSAANFSLFHWQEILFFGKRYSSSSQHHSHFVLSFPSLFASNCLRSTTSYFNSLQFYIGKACG